MIQYTYNEKEITTNGLSAILATPDHYVQKTTSAANAVLASIGTVDGDWLTIKAGTIFPSNDNKAIGIIGSTITYNTKEMAEANFPILYHGFIDTAKLPTAPTADAIAAMPLIKFI